jgi:integrase
MPIITPLARFSRVERVGDAFDALLNRTALRVAGGTRSAATLAMQREHVRYLLEQLGADMPIAELTPDRIAAALLAEAGGRRGRAVSGGTLRKRASTLSQAIELVTGQRPELPEIPYSYQPRRLFLTFDGYQALRDRLAPDQRAWFVLATWTGQRCSDVERMRREDFDPRGPAPWVVVRSWKTRRFAGIRIHAAPELVAELGPRWEQLGPGARLVARWPGVNASLRWHCARIGLEPISSHVLRHTFFTWYVQANGFTPELLEIGGWRDLTIPARVYAHALPVRFRDQIERTVAVATSLRRGPHKVPRRNQPAEKKEGPTVRQHRRAGDPPPRDYSTGTGVDRRPPISALQRSSAAIVPRDRVELSTHGFSVREARPSVVVPRGLPPTEGLCHSITRSASHAP